MTLTVDEVKAIAEIFALVAAGGYFLYRLLSGYFVVNLSVSLACTRQSLPQTPTDYLVVAASFSKGDRGSLDLHDAQIRVTWPTGEETRTLYGADRRSFYPERVETRRRNVINFHQRRKDRPFLRLTPEEQTSFACAFEVPREAVCTVELGLLGKRPGSLWIGQWRASTISLPQPARDIPLPQGHRAKPEASSSPH